MNNVNIYENKKYLINWILEYSYILIQFKNI